MIPAKKMDKSLAKKGRPTFGDRIAGNTPRASLSIGSTPAPTNAKPNSPIASMEGAGSVGNSSTDCGSGGVANLRRMKGRGGKTNVKYAGAGAVGNSGTGR